MKALVTGINGFVGSHLAEFLLEKEAGEVHGTRRHFRSNLENIGHILNRLTLHDCDLQDLGAIHRIVAEVKPDVVFHLAAQSFVGDSYKYPWPTLSNNQAGALNILEAVRIEKTRDKGYDPMIHFAGSSEEYGLVFPDEVPIKETNPLRPQSPYGVSKVAQTLLATSYFRTYGIKSVVTRAFNHTGPRRGEVFATSTFAKQVAEIEAGLKPPVIYHGNLEAKRDFTDVRDVVRAYWLAATTGEPGEIYNIASGKAISIRWVLEFFRKEAAVKIALKEEPARLRPSDVPVLLGDASKFSAHTGWQPEIQLEKTLFDLLHYWRSRFRSSS